VKVHELKCWPEYFIPIRQGRKTFEVRVADRDFQEGDFLLLKEYVPNEYPNVAEPGRYTGNQQMVKIDYLCELDEAMHLEPGTPIVGMSIHRV
jgi:ASC-1-like (ASCH) protein